MNNYLEIVSTHTFHVHVGIYARVWVPMWRLEGTVGSVLQSLFLTGLKLKSKLRWASEHQGHKSSGYPTQPFIAFWGLNSGHKTCKGSTPVTKLTLHFLETGIQRTPMLHEKFMCENSGTHYFPYILVPEWANVVLSIFIAVTSHYNFRKLSPPSKE